MAFETDNWYYKKARNHGPLRSESPRHIVIHSAETAMDRGAARSIQDYFASPNAPMASSHTMVDDREIVQCVYDSYIAYAAPGANHDGLQIEQAGYARFKRADWLTSYGSKQIDLVAKNVAQYSVKYNIPLELLSVSDLRANYKGIVTHEAVSQTFKRSSHWDPGYHYPFDILLELSQDYRNTYTGQDATKDPLPPFDYQVVITYRGEADRTAAHVLAHSSPMSTPFRVLPHDHGAFVGVELTVGYIGDHKYTRAIMGKNAAETGAFIYDAINSNWGKMMWEWGRELSDKRKAGEPT